MIEAGVRCVQTSGFYTNAVASGVIPNIIVAAIVSTIFIVTAETFASTGFVRVPIIILAHLSFAPGISISRRIADTVASLFVPHYIRIGRDLNAVIARFVGTNTLAELIVPDIVRAGRVGTFLIGFGFAHTIASFFIEDVTSTMMLNAEPIVGFGTFAFARVGGPAVVGTFRYFTIGIALFLTFARTGILVPIGIGITLSAELIASIANASATGGIPMSPGRARQFHTSALRGIPDVILSKILNTIFGGIGRRACAFAFTSVRIPAQETVAVR